MKKLFTLIAMVSIAVACNEDPLVENPAIRNVEIVASNAQVRTQLGADELTLLWEPNESIGVFGNATVNAEFESANTEAAESTTFSGAITQDDNSLVAYYPYVENATNVAAIPFTLATEQAQADGVPALAENDLKYGVLEESGENRFTCAFQQCFALVKFTIDVANSEKVKDMYLDNVWLQADDAALTGNFVLNAKKGELAAGDVTADNVNLYFTSRPALDGGSIKAWVLVNPNMAAGSTLNFMLTAVDENGENPITATSEFTTLQALEAGCAYNIPISTEFLKFAAISATPQHINFTAEGGTETVTIETDLENITATADDESWISVEKISDVEFTITASANTSTASRNATVTFTSEDGTSVAIAVSQAAAEVVPDDDTETANCYMISAAGDYSFNATVMGNGASGVIANAGFHTTDAVISGGASAELLWQDTAGFITNVSYDKSNGRINYTAAGNVGNAVIAVKDSAGTILWSWHIWGTGSEAITDQVYTNKLGSTATVMDRNLGQISKTSYYCTLYQWGRKDPITNKEQYYVGNSNEPTACDEEYPVYSVPYGTNTTIETGVQNPDKIIYAEGENGANSSGNWLREDNHYLWGDIALINVYENYPDLTLISTATASEWSYGKTIYDPCPAGYRVANRFTWTGFVTTTTGNSSNGLSYVNLVKYESGGYFKMNDSDSEGAYYPQSGSRGAKTGSMWVGAATPYNTRNYTANYWASAPNSNTYQSSQFSIGVYNTTSSKQTFPINTINFGYAENCFAVRCVRY